MRTTAVGLGAAAGMGAIGSTAGTVEAVDWGSVGTTAALGVLSPPLALGWALREYNVIGSDPPAEGLTPEVLKQEVYTAARKRKSTNASTIVDNRNIIDGVRNTAYTDAKIAAIEGLNAGSTESAVLTAAEDAVNAYMTTVQKNMLNSWNEAMSEFSQMRATVANSTDVSESDVFTANATDTNTSGSYNWSFSGWRDNESNTVTLFDGTDYTVQTLVMDTTASNDSTFQAKGDLVNTDRSGDITIDSGQIAIIAKNPNGDNVTYQSVPKWNDVYSALETAHSDVLNGISTWVTNVYGQVQSGEIEISELLTPRERAAMLSDQEGEAQAIADLAALNIPIDSEREVTITITETDATISGTIGLSDESDGPIEVGTTYDPSTFTGDVYLTGDVSQITGGWTEYETGVDGGTITLTADPYDGVTYDVTTTAGETVSVPADSWNATGSGTWTYDASGELETAITEVDSITYSSSASEPQIETLRLTRQFTVDSITNRETGEQVTAATFESSEPQTDSNYITQEEWNQLEQQNQELIEKYEESQTGGGAGAGFFPDGGPSTGVIAAVVGAIGVLYAVTQGGAN